VVPGVRKKPRLEKKKRSKSQEYINGRMTRFEEKITRACKSRKKKKKPIFKERVRNHTHWRKGIQKKRNEQKKREGKPKGTNYKGL